ncbi:LOW QUALITY PROTEIN: ceruloplasmin-like [Bombina bombina]|uniref:LOW QUALITY PROTEIN: ceruloplasmin-like n=1 Tax=Bombina bombina TaxID=8345 RepID=UPI00235B2A48|nr:LOW QUALITY PROTEIN: ceruloplasmin-like [Bombina bombina]
MNLLTSCLLLSLYFGCTSGTERTYYIGIREIYWDYAPSGMNIISGKSINDDEHVSTFLVRDTNRIGKVYKKAVYLEYTNDSYTEEIKKPEWLGFLGPIMTAEVGDKIIIHLKNFASRPYGLHPHGVEYTKKNEGAFYPDNTSGSLKKDDIVQPGESYTYKWDAVMEQGPTKREDECITRIYHSHIDSPKDVVSGVIGPLIICKTGVLSKEIKKKYEEFVLIFFVVDENLSWYIDENIETFCSSPETVTKEDEEFVKSNLMHSINGYMYGNLPGLSMCNEKEVRWYMFGMGNEVDIHSAYFHGQTLTEQLFRVDTVSLFSATMIQATMVTDKPGKWLLTCQVNDHLEGGMQAIYEIKNCTSNTNKSKLLYSKERHYYIAAEEMIWNYGPSGLNQFTGEKLDTPDSESVAFFEQNDERIGGSYKKAVYVEYTDSTFTKQKTKSYEEVHLGILGPVIFAQVGDSIKVTFRNNASRPYSIQAHGVSYSKEMEGAVYKTNSSEDMEAIPSQASHVAPGETFTYEWDVPNNVGSTMYDLNCLTWLYFSSVDPVKDTNSGLVGPLLICKYLENDKQRGIAHNFFMMPTIFDENQSWYLDDNIALFTKSPQNVKKEDPDFEESNMMHSINGYMYGNQPGLEMCTGDSVLWHMIGLGSEVDMHGIHFSGNTIINHDARRDIASLFPHISYSVRMTPDNEGLFDIKCMTTDHYTGGMKQHYRVKSCGWQRPTFEIPCTKTYYIAAEEVEWDYSPNRTWEHEMYMMEDVSPGDVFLNKGEKFIGSKYKKAVYQEYTDKTFTKRKEKKEHMGILGPLIMANVGDKIKIIFNNKASRPYSIYAHGVKTDSVSVMPTKPGDTQAYIWKVPERSGPAMNGDPDCLTWAYYSKVDQVKDTYSGLIGPLVICKRLLFGLQEPKTRFSLLFMVFDENKSWYLDDNIQTYSLHPEDVNKEDEEFLESNKMHGINGKMYGNLLGLTMQVGEKVRWHLIGMGNEVDIHTVHFHAHSFQYQRGQIYQSDVFDLFPGTFETVSMTPKVPGTWLLHCHVADHIHAGMENTYTVLGPLQASSTKGGAHQQYHQGAPVALHNIVPPFVC